MKLRALMVTLTLTAGCSSLVDDPRGVGASEQKIYLTNKSEVVRQDQIHRYGCFNGTKVVCECFGRVGRQCVCSCPL